MNDLYHSYIFRLCTSYLQSPILGKQHPSHTAYHREWERSILLVKYTEFIVFIYLYTRKIILVSCYVTICICLFYIIWQYFIYLWQYYIYFQNKEGLLLYQHLLSTIFQREMLHRGTASSS